MPRVTPRPHAHAIESWLPIPPATTCATTPTPNRIRMNVPAIRRTPASGGWVYSIFGGLDECVAAGGMVSGHAGRTRCGGVGRRDRLAGPQVALAVASADRGRHCAAHRAGGIPRGEGGRC